MKKTIPIMVCDLGYSALKYKFGEKRGRIVSAYKHHDTGIIFGEDALIKSGSSYLRGPEDLLRFYPSFVKEAIRAAGVSSPVVLAVGLPYDYWEQERKKDLARQASAISRLKEILATDQVDEVFVLPQGLGGIESYLKSREPSDGNIFAIDVGFNTIISLLYSPAKKEVRYDKTFNKKGIYYMVEELLLPMISPYIQGRTLTPVELNYLMEKGYVQHGFDKIDLRPEIERASEFYAESTLKEIIAELCAHTGGAADFDDIVFFGGGSRLFPVLDSARVKISVLPNPEFANVEGFEYIVRSYLEQRAEIEGAAA